MLSFSAGVDYPAGEDPRAVLAADVNGDGRTDLVANSGFLLSDGRGRLDVLIGNGDGTFNATAQDFPAMGRDLAAADFNGDGKADLVTGSGQVALGNGNGTFQEPRFMEVMAPQPPAPQASYQGIYIEDVAVADANGDGRADLLFSGVTLWRYDEETVVEENYAGASLGRGDGTFSPSFGDLEGRGDLAAADLNADGNVDMVWAKGVRFGLGNGTFGARHPFSAAPSLAYHVTVDDFNGDGNLDVAAADSWSTSVSGGHVVLGNGDGTFRPAQRYVSGAYQSSFAADDFNGDGKPDLVMTRSVSGADGLVTVLLGNGDGTFESPLSFTASPNPFAPTNLAVGDFNGDDLPDVAVSVTGWHMGRGSESFVRVLLNDGNWPGSRLPAVQQVYVSGSAWSDSFKQALADRGLGSSRYGFALAAGGQLSTLPWVNVDEVVVRYDAPFPAGGGPAAADFALSGVRSGYTVSAVTRLDPQTFVLRLDRALGVQPTSAGGGADGDRLELRVAGAGAGGGDFLLGFNVLQGDADQRNNRVNATDVAMVRSRQNRTAGEVPPTTLAPYTPFADLNGDGRINATDVSAVRSRQNDTVPALVAAAGTEAATASVAEDLFASRSILA